MAPQKYVQELLAGLDPAVGGVDPALPLYATTFVVVDLETTGGAPDGGGITEIGAVKVRGGEQLGVLGTLVNPGTPVPPFVTVLTGITQAMLLPAPPITEVLPSFLEFLSADAVLVAHNAPYDVGFLKAACAAHGYRWPSPRVLDTAALARRVLTRDEVPNRRLGTLAAYFRTATRPTHRALDDALATVDVLHGLIARLGGHRVHTVGEAIEFARAVTPTQRRKRHLAEGLPHSPGVYLFRGTDERPLYVGTSVDIATRVRSYFTAGEKRARISEMLAAAERVEAVECAHSLEAEVRELRLIGTHAPPYNRRSKFPERVVWLKLTDEAYPRLSVVRNLAPGDESYLGPFASRRAAELAAAGFHDAIPLRQCTHRLSLRKVTPACAVAELGRCLAPCEHRITPAEYADRATTPFRTACDGDPQGVVDALLDQSRRSRRDNATRRPRWCGPGSPPCSARSPGCSDSPRSPGSPRWWLPGRRRMEVGSWRWYGMDGWPAPRCPRPGSTHDQRSPRSGRPRRPSPRGTDLLRLPAPRRPSASCPGWSVRRRGWWRCRPPGPPRLPVRAGSEPCLRRRQTRLPTNSRPKAQDQPADRMTLTRISC